MVFQRAAGGSRSHQAVPVVSLESLVAQFLDEAPHICHGHVEDGSCLRHDILLNHDAAQVICAMFEGDLPNFQALGHPRALNVGNIVEIDAA